jgi:hypothetical protein
MQSIRNVAVYCGSSSGVHPRHAEDARALARIFVENGINLVNGGGSIGLMGVMADEVLALGGEAIGVIPRMLKEKEVAHKGLTELIVVEDMHARKLTMVNLSDAFIALPGGFGTMDELFETLTWGQLHLHRKPVIVYNPDGFYDSLFAQADLMVREGFLQPSARSLLLEATALSELLPRLVGHRHPEIDKWA